jgi:hypothetical protein
MSPNRLLPILLLAIATTILADEDSPARKAKLARDAAEKAAAEKTIAELSQRNYGTLTSDEFIRLAYAYNHAGNNRLAMDAMNRVPDAYLAEKKELDFKATCFHNVKSEDKGASRVRELAFIDRCLDKKWGNQGVWLWRKAKVLCQTSVTTNLGPGFPGGGGPQFTITDKEQYEYAFEVLKRAFEVEPKLKDLDSVGVDWLWSQDFPGLSSEQRFKDLMKE